MDFTLDCIPAVFVPSFEVEWTLTTSRAHVVKSFNSGEHRSSEAGRFDASPLFVAGSRHSYFWCKASPTTWLQGFAIRRSFFLPLRPKSRICNASQCLSFVPPRSFLVAPVVLRKWCTPTSCAHEKREATRRGKAAVISTVTQRRNRQTDRRGRQTVRMMEGNGNIGDGGPAVIVFCTALMAAVSRRSSDVRAHISQQFPVRGASTTPILVVGVRGAPRSLRRNNELRSS